MSSFRRKCSVCSCMHHFFCMKVFLFKKRFIIFCVVLNILYFNQSKTSFSYLYACVPKKCIKEFFIEKFDFEHLTNIFLCSVICPLIRKRNWNTREWQQVKTSIKLVNDLVMLSCFRPKQLLLVSSFGCASLQSFPLKFIAHFIMS